MTEAKVHVIDGQLVLEDPAALAVAKHNCQNTFHYNLERIQHFVERAKNCPLGSVVIVVLNMDDPVGAILGDALMPGTNWDAYRAEGQTPFARGLAGRAGVVDFIAEFDIEAVAALENLAHAPVTGSFESSLPVVVIDHGVIAVFPANLYK